MPRSSFSAAGLSGPHKLFPLPASSSLAAPDVNCSCEKRSVQNVAPAWAWFKSSFWDLSALACEVAGAHCALGSPGPCRGARASPCCSLGLAGRSGAHLGGSGSLGLPSRPSPHPHRASCWGCELSQPLPLDEGWLLCWPLSPGQVEKQLDSSQTSHPGRGEQLSEKAAAPASPSLTVSLLSCWEYAGPRRAGADFQAVSSVCHTQSGREPTLPASGSSPAQS